MGNFSVQSRSGSADGQVKINGVLTDAGKQLHSLLDVSAILKDVAQSETQVNGALEITVIDKDQVYINLSAFDMQPQNTLIPPTALSAFIGKWWQLPGGGTSTAGVADVTPDPSLLRMQAEVVSVTKDLGAEMIDGKPAYHYAVTVNQEKLLDYMSALAEAKGAEFDRAVVAKEMTGLTASGELWIDAVTFNLVRAAWQVKSLAFAAVSGGTFSGNFTVDLRKHNQPLEVKPPEGALPFDPLLVLQNGLSPEQEQQLISPDQNEVELSLPFYPDPQQ